MPITITLVAVVFLSSALRLLDPGITRPGPAGEAITISNAALITVSDTSAMLIWETDQPADGLVRFGTREDRLDRETREDRAPTRFHQCTLTGLMPGTTYHYLISPETG